MAWPTIGSSKNTRSRRAMRRPRSDWVRDRNEESIALFSARSGSCPAGSTMRPIAWSGRCFRALWQMGSRLESPPAEQRSLARSDPPRTVTQPRADVLVVVEDVVRVVPGLHVRQPVVDGVAV